MPFTSYPGTSSAPAAAPPAITVKCIWEHNGSDTLLWSDECPGACSRGPSLSVALVKFDHELRSYLRWSDCLFDCDAHFTPIVVEEHSSNLDIADADSDVLFGSEIGPLDPATYCRLKRLVLQSAADYQTLHDAIPHRGRLLFPARRTFYGELPRSASALYRHMTGVNGYYWQNIGLDTPDTGALLVDREEGFRLLEARSDYLANPVLTAADGELWSLKKVLRRFLWHDRIHGRALYRRIVRMYGSGRVRDVFRFLG